jgi:RNA polymerase sigma factor (sigma-70 family)
MPVLPDHADAAWLEAEQRLVERAQAGDLDALRPVLERYAPPLYAGVILPRLGDPAAAEDVLRETLATGVEKLASFRWQGRGLFGWLRQIAIHKVIDLHRRAQVSGRALEAYAVEMAVVSETTTRADEALVEREDHARREQLVRAAIDQLSPRYRQAIELRLIEERSREDCAARLGITVNNFDVLLHRAVKAFRKAWQGGEP